MASSDLSVLLDMGFEKERAELAVKKTGGCMYTTIKKLGISYDKVIADENIVQGALQWLEDNQDKSLEEVQDPAPTTTTDDNDANVEPPALNPGEEAKSLVCNECGKRFRSTAQAEFHASKT